MQGVLSSPINKILLISSMAAFRCVFYIPRLRDASEHGALRARQFYMQGCKWCECRIFIAEFLCTLYIFIEFKVGLHFSLSIILKTRVEKNMNQRRNVLGIHFTFLCRNIILYTQIR